MSCFSFPPKKEKIPHSTGFSGGMCHRSAKAS
jgi:hypothetical protein